MMYNTKIKIYCDGTTNTVYCNKFVFGNREIKDTDTKYEHISERYAFDSGYLIPDKQNLVDDYYIHNDSAFFSSIIIAQTVIAINNYFTYTQSHYIMIQY